MERSLEDRLDGEQRAVLESLTTPAKIQAFLDTCTYKAEYENASSLRVLSERRAHCLDGGLFGAAALRRLGYTPRVVDIFPDPGMDDDHVLALFQVGGRWGAVAKSDFVGLRYRDPVYATLRELIMSYFEQYYNIDGIKSLRTYTIPVNLARYDSFQWETTDEGVNAIEKILLSRKRYPLLTPEVVAALEPVDELTYRAGMLVVNMEGLYKPRKQDE